MALNCSDDYLEALAPDIARRGHVLRYVWYRQNDKAAWNPTVAAVAAAAEGDYLEAVAFDGAAAAADDAAASDLMEALVARERDRFFFYLSWDKDAHLATVDGNGSVAFTVQKKDFGRFTCEVHRIAANGKAEKFHEIDFLLQDHGNRRSFVRL